MFCIYVITHKQSGKCYVGQTRQRLVRRWGLHKSRMRKGYPYHLYCAMRKYGENAFDVIEITTVDDQVDASDLERLWIVCLRTTDSRFGYNNTYGGEGFGKKTKESIEKHRQKIVGKKHAEETKRRRSESLEIAWASGVRKGGYKLSLLSRQKMSAARQNDKHHAYRHDVTNAHIAYLCDGGLKNSEIAKRLGIWPSTVARRLKKINLRTEANCESTR